MPTNYDLPKREPPTAESQLIPPITQAQITKSRGHTISANEPIGSGADESGERGAETNTGELRGKLQQIRGLNKQYNPAEQRRVTEADKRTAQQARAEAERVKNEQRNVEREHFSRRDKHER